MESYSFNFIKVDLRLINTTENCKRILKDNNIPEDRVCHKKLFELKPTLDIIFLDQKTYSIAAFIQKKEKQIEFVKDVLDEMHGLNPITYVKKEITVQAETLKLDSILEKISDKGMDSLTPREKEFLDNQSKK